MKFDVQESIKQQLLWAKDEGTRVRVLLRGGASYRGKVGDVSDRLLVIAEIEGQEFFDALICLDDVCALEARARESLD